MRRAHRGRRRVAARCLCWIVQYNLSSGGGSESGGWDRSGWGGRRERARSHSLTHSPVAISRPRALNPLYVVRAQTDGVSVVPPTNGTQPIASVAAVAHSRPHSNATSLSRAPLLFEEDSGEGGRARVRARARRAWPTGGLPARPRRPLSP